MLSLMDPVELEDLVVFRDDEEPRKFYLLPDQPVIPLDDEGAPEFLFIKYLADVESTAEGEDLGGGYVQFRSVLGIDPARRQRVVDALRARLEEEKAAGKKPFGVAITATEPLLAEPLWSEGKASLATFKVSDTGLVRHATETVPVDLAGDLGASVALQLDPAGAEIFWNAFQEHADRQLPILVTYQLTYKARVSAKMEIHASRSIVHQKIWNAARPYRFLAASARYAPVAFAGAFGPASFMALRAASIEPLVAMIPRPAIQEVIHKTIVDNEITVRIETDQAGGGEEEAAVREMLFKVATEVLSDRVIPALFGDAAPKPSVNEAGGGEGASDLLELRPGDDAGEASFDLVLDHLSTIERQVNPNGPVHLLLASEQAMAACFRELRLTDGYFSAMKVTAGTAGVNFERDGIDSIHVFFRYEQRDDKHPDRPWVRRSDDGLLRSERDALYWRFDLARDAAGGHKRQYEYRMEVFYREGPPSSTNWTPRDNRMLTITPRAMGVLRVELVLTARQVVDSARVVLRHQAASGARYETALELSPETKQRTWFQFTGELAESDSDLNRPEYTYQVTYRVGGGEIVMPPVRSTAQTLEIPGPFRKVIAFNLRPQGSFEGVSHVSGDVVYDDPAHQYRLQKSFQLEALTSSFLFEVPVLEGGPERARWTARVNRQDGSALDLAPGEGPPGTVWLGTEIDFLTVQIVPDLLDFETDVQLAVVQMSRADGDGATPQRQTFTFSKSARAPQTWRVGRREHDDGAYDADIRYIAYDRTKSSEVHLRQIADQVLVLDRAPQA